MAFRVFLHAFVRVMTSPSPSGSIPRSVRLLFQVRTLFVQLIRERDVAHILLVQSIRFDGRSRTLGPSATCRPGYRSLNLCRMAGRRKPSSCAG